MSSRSSARSWILALVATLTMAVSYADRQALAVLAPKVTKALQISEPMYGWLLSAFSLAYLVGAPVAGRWIDGLGARRGLTRAVLAWSVVAALHALVPSLFVLFFLRIALGFAEAPSFPGAAQTVHRALVPEDRPRGFGILFVGSSLGAMVVPPLVATLELHFGYRIAFLGTALAGLAWLPLWWWATSNPEARALLDRSESAAPAQGSLFRWLREPAVLRGILVILAASPLMSYALNWSSKYLVAVHGLSLQAVGGMLWFPPILYDIGSIGFGIAASAQLRRGGLTSGPPRLLLIISVALASTLALVPHAPTAWLATTTIGVAMAGGGGLFALATSDLLSRVPATAVSTCSGLSAAAQSFAYVIASPLIGWGVQGFGHGSVQASLALWILPGCLAWLLWRPPPRVEAQLAL
jgi:ACS family hexuronate transporter-like MFS transporter